MLRVRILGSGLIPRGGGLAPKKEPILVDFNYLTILMYTRNLKIQYLDPDTNKFENMNLFNFKKIYDKISPKVDLQLKTEREAAKKVEEETAKTTEQLKTEVDKGVETIVEERPQFFTRKDKHFKKN